MRIVRLLSLLASIAPLLAASSSARAEGPAFHELWRQGGEYGFEGWSLAGVRVDGGRLVLNPTSADVVAAAGQVLPGTVWRGTAIGPERESAEPFRDLIPSWNAETPSGTWVEVRLRARVDGRWSGWYVLGLWSADGGSTPRWSVDGQDDADARVLTDTLALRSLAQAFQLSLTLVSTDSAATPRVSLAAVLASRRSDAPPSATSEPRARGTVLRVPERSQMIYPGGGEVWCSPTSISMVLAYWAERLGEPVLDRSVPEVAAGTYDPTYDGHGNWPFNTAYAGRESLTAYVSRFSSLNQVERWIEVGAPVVASLAWGFGTLADASVPSTDGHLLVIIGFSDRGDVVVNDPAGDPRRGQAVRRVYRRDQFESLWLQSGGTVYLIHPNAQAPSADGAFGAW